MFGKFIICKNYFSYKVLEVGKNKRVLRVVWEVKD